MSILIGVCVLVISIGYLWVTGAVLMSLLGEKNTEFISKVFVSQMFHIVLCILGVLSYAVGVTFLNAIGK